MQMPSARLIRCALLAAILLGVVSAVVGQIPPSTWIQLNPRHSPPQRAACSMAYDPVSHKVVMFGGFGRYHYFNDTWTFDGTNWKRQKAFVAPSARAASSMAFDRVLQKLVLYGGYDGQNYQGDTWTWDG